jgi:ribose transport system permease protein
VPVLEWFRYVPFRLILLLVLAGALAVLMHASVYGRYLFAVGANEQAARYAGIRTDRYKVFAYVLCSMLAALGGMLEVLDLKTSSPSSTGQNYELYAITGAVLGGCSLRGGEGTILGILLGTAVLPLLRTLCNTYLPSDLEYLVIGLALLAGTIADELVKRRGQRRT